MGKQKLDLPKRQVDIIVKSIQGMSHPVRFMILYALLSEELSVNELSEIIGASQSVTSQHLGKLRNSGLLEYRKESNKVFYYIKDNRHKEVLKSLLKSYGDIEKNHKK